MISKIDQWLWWGQVGSGGWKQEISGVGVGSSGGGGNGSSGDRNRVVSSLVFMESWGRQVGWRLQVIIIISEPHGCFCNWNIWITSFQCLKFIF